MEQYISKDALVAEIGRITDEQQEICKADVALGKAPDSKNIEVIYQFQQFKKFLDTLEVKEVDLEKKKMEWIEQLCKYFKANYLYVRGHESFISNFRMYAKNLK